MSLSLFTGWFVGAINGYKYNEGGLPNSIKYGTMGLVTGANIVNILSKYIPKNTDPRILLGALIIGAPIVSGTVFCLGHYVGKAVGYSNESGTNKNESSIKLL